jgi:membrane fusion protein, copper/silver efflux system
MPACPQSRRWCASKRSVAVIGTLLLAAACSKPTAEPPQAASAAKPLYYRNPMDPSVTSPTPAKDSMGMDYVPVYANHSGGHAVQLSPELIQSLGVRTVPVRSEPLRMQTRVAGVVSYDERGIRDIRVRAEAWVEDLRVRTQGEAVQAGQLLFQVYSSRLEVAEQEYLSSLQFNDAGRIALAEQRLKDVGVEPGFIARLREERVMPHLIPFHAPVSGVVTELNVREGSFVMHETLVMRLASLDRVWVIAEVPQRFAALARVGDTAPFTIDGYPERDFSGRIAYVYPQIDADTRTVKVRIEVPNSDGALKPNMYASVTLSGGSDAAVLQVPRDCVIRDGSGARVLVALGEGRFVPRPVRLGAESGDAVAILEGVQAGDQVVASAVFLIDAEASLRSSLARFEPGPKQPGEAAAAPDGQP